MILAVSRPHSTLLEVARGGVTYPIYVDKELLDSAIEHRMAGLLQSAIVAGSVLAAPEVLKELERHDLETWARHQVLIDELGRVKDILDRAGIEFMILKGVTAEARWYRRPGERPSWDLDVLLEPKAIAHLDEVLEMLQPGHVLLGSSAMLATKGYLQSVNVFFGRVVVDLHTDIFKLGVKTRSNDLVWDTVTTVDLKAAGELRVPSASVALVHFLTHLNRDRFNRLLGLVDVARVLEDPALDWRLVDQLVRAEGLEVVAMSGLRVVENTLGRKSRSAFEPRGWRSSVWKYAWGPHTRLLGQEGRVRFARRSLLIPALLEGRFLEAIRFWRKRLFPPAAVVEYLHGAQPGGTWSKMIRGRVRYMLRRFRARKDLGSRGQDQDNNRA